MRVLHGFSESPVIDSSSAAKPPVTLCKVCGDRASGYHYGVTSCEGCKVRVRHVQYMYVHTCTCVRVMATLDNLRDVIFVLLLSTRIVLTLRTHKRLHLAVDVVHVQVFYMYVVHVAFAYNDIKSAWTMLIMCV